MGDVAFGKEEVVVVEVDVEVEEVLSTNNWVAEVDAPASGLGTTNELQEVVQRIRAKAAPIVREEDGVVVKVFMIW